jgi:hypothetical protein
MYISCICVCIYIYVYVIYIMYIYIYIYKTIYVYNLYTAISKLVVNTIRSIKNSYQMSMVEPRWNCDQCWSLSLRRASDHSVHHHIYPNVPQCWTSTMIYPNSLICFFLNTRLYMYIHVYSCVQWESPVT